MLRFETISPTQIDRYVHSKKVLIIDIRTPKEFDEGHIENAINIPFSKLSKEYNKMPRDLILILYCQSGGTGLLAAKELYDRGYVVKAMIGGYDAYKKNHLT